MANLIFLFGLLNLIGGRSDDIFGKDALPGRLLFRCILPGMAAGLFAYGINSDWEFYLYVWACVTLGSALWFAPGWSFDEITGQYDAAKYPAILQKIARKFFPLGGDEKRNRTRGIFLKGMRGLYDILTFASLSFINPMAIFLWPLTALQGVVYWFFGRVTPTYSVMCAELFYGAFRGGLITIAIMGV